MIEFSERLSYFGIATSLMLYLTKVLQQDMKTAAENANYWMSVTTLMPLLGGFLADAYLGRFSTVLFSTLIYLMGLAILAVSQLAPALKPTVSLRRHETLFFVGIYLVSVGTGGHKPALESFGADQFDGGHPGERRQKMSYFNWWNCALCSGVLLGVTAVVYVQERLGWGAADLLLAAVMAGSLVVYLAGYRTYRFRVPDGSPLSPLLRVAVAAFLKRRLRLPNDAAELHHEDLGALPPQEGGSKKKKKRMLCHTEQFRFLDKAAVVDGGKWLATVTEVEETKLVLAMVPIWLTTLAFGVTAAQVSTFFIKQGSVMDRRLGPSFEIPPASVFALAAVGMILAVAAYDKLLEPYVRRAKGAAAERGISILQRIGVGMGFGILAMAVAAAVERRRLRSPSPASMSVFWLVPQFVLMGVGDGFALVGLQEYFYEQVPDNMRSLGIGLYLSVIGAGSFLSGVIIAAADRATSGGGSEGWFGKDLAHSRLDLFYWLLAVIGAINLGFYVLVATRYSYKQTVAKAATASSARVGHDIECANVAGDTA